MMVDGSYDGSNQSEKKDDNLVLEKEKENVNMIIKLRLRKMFY